MNKDKFSRFSLIVLTLIVLSIAKSWLISNLMMSFVCSILGDDGYLSTILTVILTNILLGALACLPLYWQMRDDSEDRRSLLEFFSEKEYNVSNLKEYLKKFKSNKIVFAVALIIALVFEYMPSPYGFIDMIIAFILMFGVYLLFEHIVRRKIYDKWYAERLHK